MNVLIYSGPETLPSSLKSTLSSLQRALRTSYSVQTITPQALKSQPWSTSCALFVFPQSRTINSFQWNSSLNSYVDGGGSVLCLSSGLTRRLGSSGSNSLYFYNKNSGEYLYPTYTDEAEEDLRSVGLKTAESVIEGIFQSGRRVFEGTEQGKGARVLASYADSQDIAAVEVTMGSGKVAFWGPNLEQSTDVDDIERRRIHVLQLALKEAGIRSDINTATPPTRPLPQFLVSSRHGAIQSVLGSIGQSSDSTLEDTNDKFHFHPSDKAIQLVNEARSLSPSSSDPATWQPKHVVVFSEGIPESALTPLFDIPVFFRTLADARTKERCPTIEGWGFGEVLSYGEAVTSTQTMLDKNPHLLSTLPVPYLSLASHQIAGRGRGSNSWVSPAGCLQFSLLLRLPLSTFPANKLVFIQYLMALAIAEAARDDLVLGGVGSAVRIKWPNDIYAVFGEGKAEEKKKIGGILVSTSFSGGKVDIVIGCGINVLNPPPIFSLSQLQDSAATPLSMERTAAVIMAKFEKMWGTFVAGRGDFTPFMDLYLDRWLHSDQLVKLATTSPPMDVRICGITSDHGLLRTLPERGGGGFIDLQPDGNSFDLMAGLIKSKA